MFKLLKQGMIKRLADGACIPPDSANSDYQRYLEWVADGNAPEPADPEPAPVDQADIDNMEKKMKAILLCVAEVGGLTNAQIRAMFRNKMNSLP